MERIQEMCVCPSAKGIPENAILDHGLWFLSPCEAFGLYSAGKLISRAKEGVKFHCADGILKKDSVFASPREAIGVSFSEIIDCWLLLFHFRSNS